MNGDVTRVMCEPPMTVVSWKTPLFLINEMLGRASPRLSQGRAQLDNLFIDTGNLVPGCCCCGGKTQNIPFTIRSWLATIPGECSAITRSGAIMKTSPEDIFHAKNKSHSTYGRLPNLEPWVTWLRNNPVKILRHFIPAEIQLEQLLL